ncbi:MAG: Type 1 glutamine amidotransferase-like domain-containing protein [Candidatus Moraniibacteriota bacterium]
MTKYILHGGNLREKNELNKKFFVEIGKNLNEGDSLLLCYFAPSTQSNRSEEEKFDVGLGLFKSGIDKYINYVFAKRNNFIEQLRKVDGLYIHGGDTDKLFETLKSYPEFIEEMKKKKLVAGSSAGAYILSEYSIDYPEKTEAIKRFGVLPIKIFCHFEEKDRKFFEEEFRKVDKNEELETIFLRNCEMAVFEK